MLLRPSIKKCKSPFLMSQIISNLSKFLEKLLIFMSPNRFSMKIYCMVNLLFCNININIILYKFDQI
jgi:hypothetical protein